MNELVFQVKFLSDVVLPATSNTEGNIKQLDFIPGSNFLGMLAKDYNDFKESFAVFHSGSVRFGDATVLCDTKQTYKMPLSFFHEKLNVKKIYTHHYIKDFSKLTQLKQCKSAYITSDKVVMELDYTYSQKSAYDKEHRRSKDSSMFGYTALKSGTLWQFTLKYDHTICEEDLKKIKTNLIGRKRLGKSKSAQYAHVEISAIGSNENIEDLTLSDEVVLYVNSRLSLVDEDGNSTYNLTKLCDGLSDKNILYEKTQVKTSTFTPYNLVRGGKDYERVCINKGSVIVLKEISQEQLDSIKKGVGAYLSEGFGDILINPSFLKDNEFSFKEKNISKTDQKSKTELTDKTALFLRFRETKKENQLDLANEVHEFIKNHKSLYSQKMNSQWGTIRSICSNTTNIYDDVDEYISHGVAKDKWKGSKKSTLLDAIKYSSNKLAFTKLLSMQMPKVKDKDSKDEN